MSIEKGAAKYGSQPIVVPIRQSGLYFGVLTNTEVPALPSGKPHTAAPRSVGNLQQTNCPKTGKPEHVQDVGNGEIECMGCRAKIPYNAISR